MPQNPPGKRSLTKEDKLRLKKLQKKKELLGLYREKRISEEQFIKGMNKLGYSADVEKVLAFKKFIQEQIQAFEKMDVTGAKEGQYHFDPNESKAELPRDEYGNVITDFSVSPKPASHAHMSEAYSQPAMVPVRPPPSTTSAGGPVFGDNLFGGGRPSKRSEVKKEVPKATLKRDVPRGPTKISNRRRRSTDLEWDEDEEEEEEEDFEIDLGEPRHGWWDDEDWELDWSDEDEEEWEDWELDAEEEEEEDEWEVWEHRLEGKGRSGNVTVEFEDDEEEEDGDVYDPVKYYWGSDESGEEAEEEVEEEEEEDDDDWDDPPRHRRRRNY